MFPTGIHAKQEEIEVDFRELVEKNLTRPMRMLVSEPIVLALSIYMGFVYGLLYLFLSFYPIVFQEIHGFNQGVGGLPFFGMVNLAISNQCLRVYSDYASRLSDRRRNVRRCIHDPDPGLVHSQACGEQQHSNPRMAFTSRHYWRSIVRYWTFLVWCVSCLSNSGYGLRADVVPLQDGLATSQVSIGQLRHSLGFSPALVS